MLFDPGGGAPGVIRTFTGTYRAFVHTVHIGLSNILYLLAHAGLSYILLAHIILSFILFTATKMAFRFLDICTKATYLASVHLLLRMEFCTGTYWAYLQIQYYIGRYRT
jgi:hypothetical protein